MENSEKVVIQFSRGLRLLRQEYNLTQEELAERADISYKNIQYLEAQEPTCPSLVTLHKIAKAFNISLAQLFKKLGL